jgi:putative transposase
MLANGKQEVFWANVEGRLMAMLTRTRQLTLALLNQATQAWVELDYHRIKHSQTTQTPLDRFINSPQVGRPAPCPEDLRQAFRQDLTRTQRRSDGTITLDGVRFELPNRFRRCRQVTVRYARWNLRDVHLVDPKTDAILTPIYPWDKAGNADGRRRVLPADPTPEVDSSNAPTEQLAPLLRQLIADYAATGIPPAYIPKPDTQETTEARS